MLVVLPVIAALLLIAAVVSLWLAWRRQKLSGLPQGKIVYTDMGDWVKVDKNLYDGELGLVGRPDYLVENKLGILPVEVKSTRGVEAPYEGHLLQLAAYLHLVEVEYQSKPPVGYIHYPGKTFQIENTKSLEAKFSETLAALRSDAASIASGGPEVTRSHQSVGRCQSCGYRKVCPESLA